MINCVFPIDNKIFTGVQGVYIFENDILYKIILYLEYYVCLFFKWYCLEGKNRLYYYWVVWIRKLYNVSMQQVYKLFKWFQKIKKLRLSSYPEWTDLYYTLVL